jgi:nucleotide-binding universal stress UspA family protein
MISTSAAGLSADLVVMGTVARTGISGLIIGNTAEAILDQLMCSVLAVKPPGFTSPVKLDK